jgi:hypothetical protein
MKLALPALLVFGLPLLSQQCAAGYVWTSTDGCQQDRGCSVVVAAVPPGTGNPMNFPPLRRVVTHVASSVERVDAMHWRIANTFSSPQQINGDTMFAVYRNGLREWPLGYSIALDADHRYWTISTATPWADTDRLVIEWVNGEGE